MTGVVRGDPDEIGGYIVERRLGQGGQATVFLARAADGSAVAVKVLREEWLADPEARLRLDREIQANCGTSLPSPRRSCWPPTRRRIRRTW